VLTLWKPLQIQEAVLVSFSLVVRSGSLELGLELRLELELELELGSKLGLKSRLGLVGGMSYSLGSG